MPEGWSYFLVLNGEKLRLAEGRQVVGRSQSCDVSIQDASISRQHAALEVAAGVITVTDLGSSNGTFLNGQQLTGPSPVRSGDRLGLGDAELEVQIVPPSFETVRLPSGGVGGHGEATAFLQAASVQLAIEALSHETERLGGEAERLGEEAEPLAALDDPFADVPPEIFDGDPLAAKDEGPIEDWEIPDELTGQVEVPVIPPPTPPPPVPAGGELLPSLEALDEDLALPELPPSKAGQPGLLGRLFGRRSK